MLRSFALVVALLALQGCGAPASVAVDTVEKTGVQTGTATNKDIAAVDRKVAHGEDEIAANNEKIADLNGQIAVLQSKNKIAEEDADRARKDLVKKVALIFSGLFMLAAAGCAIAAVFTSLRRLWLLSAAFVAGIIVLQTTSMVFDHLRLTCGLAAALALLATWWVSTHHASVADERDVLKAEADALRTKLDDLVKKAA